VPELPEVETTRRGLLDALEGQRLREVQVLRERMARRNDGGARQVEDRLRGRRVLELGRHGKFIIGRVEDHLRLVLHLGMSGRMEVRTGAEEMRPHTNVIITTDVGQVRFVDPRTFGFIAAWTTEECEDSSLAELGPDALEHLPRSRALAERMAGRTVAIKTLLLNQSFVAGLGNIYADEVLIRAGVHPERSAGSLSAEEVGAIRRHIRPVLKAGLQHGGTSLDDLAYLLPDGRAGEYVRRLRAYGREDEPCRKCGTPIRRTVIGQRSSFWCPTCQPRADKQGESVSPQGDRGAVSQLSALERD